MKFNINEVKSSCDIVDVVSRRLTLTRKGPEHVGQCPFHNDKHASLMVNQVKQMYKCFACGSVGDAIDFLVNLGLSFSEACEEITGQRASANTNGTVTTQRDSFKKAPAWSVISPVPKNTIQPSFEHYRHGKPSKYWQYRTQDDQLIGYVCRFDTPSGKEVTPLSYAKNDKGQTEWRWMGFNKPRPLFGLQKLKVDPNATILIVEGEKCAETAQHHFPIVEGGRNIMVLSWIGGPEGVNYTDWSPIYGRNIIIWPDNDYSHRFGVQHAKAGELMPFEEQPGIKAAMRIHANLKEHCTKIKFVRNPDGKPCGWDIADDKWEPEAVRTYIKSALVDMPVAVVEYGIEAAKPVIKPSPPKPEPVAGPKTTASTPPAPAPPAVVPPRTPTPPQPDPIDPRFITPNFRFLGYEQTDGEQAFYFYSYRSNQSVRYKASSLSKNNLMCLGGINWWEDKFRNKNGLDMTAAVNYVIETSMACGVHDPSLIRGRGAWIDNGQTVINVGSHLLVDSRHTEFKHFRSKFIYQSGTELEFNVENPLTAKEANQLVNMLQIISWDRDANAYLLAGWCIVAPICGVLKWRPHIWITGAAGTGKSWLMALVKHLVGNMSVSAQGDTTEPGLRQVLNSDARPVLFDEAESEGRVDNERMQKVLSLMRSSSTNEGGDIIKGSSGGSAIAYKIRSCFAYSSIGLAISSAADRSRVSVLGIHRIVDEKDAAERWERLQKAHAELITEEWVNRLRARTAKLTPVILKNCRVFSKAAASELGDQRSGDQIGALLAGVYTLFSDHEISFDKAVEFIRQRDWSEERQGRETKDEVALVHHLMDCPATIENSSNVKLERSVGEIIQVACGFIPTEGFDQESAIQRIRRMGYKIDSDYLVISNKSAFLSKCLQGTAWAKNHGAILCRIKGAVKMNPTTFGSGTTSRAVRIPLIGIFESGVRVLNGESEKLPF